MTDEELAEIDGHRFCSCDCDGNVCREYAEKLITEVRRLQAERTREISERSRLAELVSGEEMLGEMVAMLKPHAKDEDAIETLERILNRWMQLELRAAADDLVRKGAR